MQKEKIIIIGAGPKALNILAKSNALKQLGWNVPEIIVLEKNEIGANWTGNSGYTDGKGILGISPFKTFNYPTSSIFGEKVLEYMNKYSYTNYLSSIKKLEKWVDGGMGWITHKEFSEYLKWIGSYFSDQIHFGEVVKVQAINYKWHVDYCNEGHNQSLVSDGLIFTGPGEILNPFSLKTDNVIVHDGKNWWKEKDKFKNHSGSIALIGGGISAGAIFESLMPMVSEKSNVDWYTRKGLFTRSENFANNERFSFPDLWQQIPIGVRESFVSSTDKGSIDSTTHKVMSDYNQFFQEIISEIKSIEIINEKIKIVFEDGLCKKERFYEKVILCTGFSNTDFLKLLDQNSKEFLESELCYRINPDLSVNDFTPKLHLPMLASIKVGIGCATLGSPSVMSDRILSSWVSQSLMLEQNQNVEVGVGDVKGDSLFAKKEFSIGEVIVNGYPTKFSVNRTKTSVQIGIDLHMEPSHFFVKANHSCNPNCGIQLNNFNGYSLVAMKEIKVGEEITWDYAMTEWESVALENQNCKCGSEYCRGSIGGYKNLSKELKQKYFGFSASYLKFFE